MLTNMEWISFKADFRLVNSPTPKILKGAKPS